MIKFFLLVFCFFVKYGIIYLMKNTETFITELEDVEASHKKIQNKEHKKASVWVVLYRIGCGILIFVSLCIIAFNIVFDHNKIVGSSMQPTYNYPDVKKEDYAFYSSFFNIDRGNIIVAKNASNLVIKRLIAIEGDKFELKKHSDSFFHIFVNDVIQDESYLLDISQNEHLYRKIKNQYEINWIIKPEITITEDSISFVIPENYCFYLGDNRLESADCADYGPVLKETVTHKVIFVVPDGTNFIAYWFRRIFS